MSAFDFKTEHDGCQIRLYADIPFIHLDLGFPNDSYDSLTGPRITCRRVLNGWRIIIAPDGDVTEVGYDIFPGDFGKPPVMKKVKSP
jgi:hypothetical protein